LYTPSLHDALPILDVSCGAPAVTSNPIAVLESCFPAVEVTEYQTDAGTVESVWHFRQRSEVSTGVAGLGQIRSGTAAWNGIPVAAVIWACVWHAVQSTWAA